MWYNCLSCYVGGDIMANIKSAQKKIRVINKKTLVNKMRKNEIKTYIKKFEKAIAEENFDLAKDLIKVIDKKLSKAAHKHLLHKNNAARKMSRLQKMLNKTA